MGLNAWLCARCKFSSSSSYYYYYNDKIRMALVNCHFCQVCLSTSLTRHYVIWLATQRAGFVGRSVVVAGVVTGSFVVGVTSVRPWPNSFSLTNNQTIDGNVGEGKAFYPFSSFPRISSHSRSSYYFLFLSAFNRFSLFKTNDIFACIRCNFPALHFCNYACIL